MRTSLFTMVLVLALAGSVYAADIRHAESGFYDSLGRVAVANCDLSYHDICSAWVYTWTGYNDIPFAPGAKVGVCYDMTDCSLGCQECQNLEGVKMGWKRFTPYGRIDLEIFCAAQDCCPVGPPIGGVYNYHLDPFQSFQYIDFDGLPLHCVDCKFIVMATILTPQDCAPYSDANDKNVESGCEPQWRCAGHSYCYVNEIDYCYAHGYPGRMLVEDPDACPGTGLGGFYVEWLCFAYIDCRGPTATEERTWSEIKAFYR